MRKFLKRLIFAVCFIPVMILPVSLYWLITGKDGMILMDKFEKWMDK